MVRNVRFLRLAVMAAAALLAAMAATMYFCPLLSSRLGKAKPKPAAGPNLEQRVGILENAHDSLVRENLAVKNRLGTIDNRLGNLGIRTERRFAAVDSRFSDLDARVQRRIARLQRKLQAKLKARRLRLSSVHVEQMTIEKVSTGNRQDLWDVRLPSPPPSPQPR